LALGRGAPRPRRPTQARGGGRGKGREGKLMAAASSACPGPGRPAAAAASASAPAGGQEGGIRSGRFDCRHQYAFIAAPLPCVMRGLVVRPARRLRPRRGVVRMPRFAVPPVRLSQSTTVLCCRLLPGSQQSQQAGWLAVCSSGQPQPRTTRRSSKHVCDGEGSGVGVGVGPALPTGQAGRINAIQRKCCPGPPSRY
jgi:hypothetical protein